MKFLKYSKAYKFLWLFLFFAGLSIFFAYDKVIAAHSFIRLIFLSLIILSIANGFNKKILRFQMVTWVFSYIAIFQSLIAIFQFQKQSSLGLKWLGEPILQLGEHGVANFLVGGVRILRGYGTFLHPNILAAFLVIGLLCLCYLWFKRLRSYEFITNNTNLKACLEKVFFAIALFVVLLGLVLTFSRSAWLVTILSLVTILFFALRNPPSRRLAIYLFLILLTIGYTITASFSPFIFPRASFNASEPAVADRLIYNKLGLEIIVNNPFGVGVGNQVIFASQNKLYEKFGLTELWQKQPIHNLYLLIASEIGILGLVAFLLLIFFICKNCDFILKIPLFALLALGLFDHYLWDIWDGQLLLAIFIGMVMGASLRPRSSTDRMFPSEGNDAGSIPAEDTFLV